MNCRISSKNRIIAANMLLVQTCIIHYCFLGIQEFNNFIELDVVLGFFTSNFHPAGVVYPGLVTYFFNHINRNWMIIL